MVEVLAVLVFGGALALSTGVIIAMVAPQWRRIAHLATGHVEPAFQPLSHLAAVERRIAVRRWAAASPARRLPEQRAAA